MKCFITGDESVSNIYYLARRGDNIDAVDIPEELYVAYVSACAAFDEIQKQLSEIYANEVVPRYQADFEKRRDGQNKDVHTEHCCVVHGCKYGDRDCPVANKVKVQSYRCESCGTPRGFERVNPYDLAAVRKGAKNRRRL